MTRPSLDEYFINMLDLVASRSTCRRRNVACVITDEKGHIISTGYNGVPSGIPHCIDTPCAGAKDESGNNRNCLAIHAEQNALIQAGAKLPLATRLYCSCTPCFDCAKLVISAQIRTVIVKDTYTDVRGLELLKSAGVHVYLAYWATIEENELGESIHRKLELFVL